MFTKWIVRLRALFRRDDVEAEFDEELRFHLDQETERYVGRGMSLEEARHAARRDLGDPGRVKEEARETWRWRWVDDLLLDVRYARRGLVRSAGFTVVAALSLGFGIGATTSLFSVIDALDLRPLPYRDADRLVWLADVTPSDHPSCPGCPFSTSPSTVALWSEQARSYEALAFWSASDVYFGQGDVADYVSVGYASAGFFELLGVTPLLGRGISVEDTVSGADPIVLLSYESWQSRFGGDRSVLGERIEFYSDPALTDSRFATVVGVLPAGFRFGSDASFWLALSGGDAARRFIEVIARLEPDATLAGAESELRGISSRLAEADPSRSEDRESAVLPLRERLGWGASPGRLLLFGVTALVLLLAVMNVAGLSLARTMSRQSELTVRTSLGASPVRLVRQLVVEGICLGSIGGVVGALLAVWGTRVANHWFRLEGSGIPLRIDHRVLAFGACAAVLVGMLTALLPSLWAARWNLQNALGDRSGAMLRPRLRQVTAVLLVTQIASGLVLLTGAGVLSSEFLKLRYLTLGFDPANLYQVSLFGSRELRAAPESWRPALDEARRRVASIPGVESAALVHTSAIHPSVVRAEGSADNATPATQTARVQAVDASYFETYATTLLDGSAFTSADRRGGRPVCVINVAAAAAFWRGERAIGGQVFVGDSAGGEWLTVVGVVANLEQGEMAGRQWPIVYRPLDQAPLYHPAASLSVRLTGRGETHLAALQKTVAEALGHPVSAFEPVAAVLDRRFRTQRFNALALDLFAVFALLLAAIGIYGSVAYAVARRTREIGVRVALGAQRSRVLRLVTGRTMWVVIVGLLLGVLGSMVLTRALRVFVSATSTTDPRMFAAAVLLVFLVALIATWLPANRATAVDPLIALRNE